MLRFALLALLAAALAGQSTNQFVLRGRLISTDGTPIRARVTLDRTEAVSTDERGRFEFYPLPAKEYVLSVETEGFRVDPRPVDGRSGRTVDLGEWRLQTCATRPEPTRRAIPELRPDQIVMQRRAPDPSIAAPPRPSLGISRVEKIQDNLKHAPIDQHNCCCPVSPADPIEFQRDPHAVLYFETASLAALHGPGVRRIRVLRAFGSDEEVREQILRLWQVPFGRAVWSEGNAWNIEAVVEYERGPSRSLILDSRGYAQIETANGMHYMLRRETFPSPTTP